MLSEITCLKRLNCRVSSMNGHVGGVNHHDMKKKVPWQHPEDKAHLLNVGGANKLH